MQRSGGPACSVFSKANLSCLCMLAPHALYMITLWMSPVILASSWDPVWGQSRLFGLRCPTVFKQQDKKLSPFPINGNKLSLSQYMEIGWTKHKLPLYSWGWSTNKPWRQTSQILKCLFLGFSWPSRGRVHFLILTLGEQARLNGAEQSSGREK